MSCKLLLGASTIALAVGVAAASSPAGAQVAIPLADVSIEGPIQNIIPTPGAAAGRSWAGTMRVMGVTVRVLNGATVHTPTNDNLGLDPGDTVPNTNKALRKLDGQGYPAAGQTWALPGRTAGGFNGGTAIITGESEAGIIYATDVFSDLAENVVVGEATGVVKGADQVERVTINKMALVKIEDERMPGGTPINGFGFEIDPKTVTVGTLLSAEGYFAGGRLYYHTIEADSGVLINAASPEVSILRASCRIRGRNRDELEVRGGVHVPPANATQPVTIQYLKAGANPELAASWQSVAPLNIAPVADPTVTPPQGLYRYSASNLNLGAVCPAQVRAILPGVTVTDPTTGVTAPVASAAFAPDSR